MSDDRDRGRPPRKGGSGRPPGKGGGYGGGKSFRGGGSAGDGPRKPFRTREDGDRPRGAGSDERPPRRFDDGGARKPFRPRVDADRPRRFDSGGERKPFRPRPRPDAAGPQEAAQDSAFAGERIAKAMARAGLCSRRDAEEWIAEGRVSVNGAIIDSPALNITAADKVMIDGEPMPERERTRLWLYHKPAGLVTTVSDPEGRDTVFQNLPDDLPRVVSIGRLDINTEGLLLLTNDGGLSRTLAHPETGWLRRYRVRAHGETDQAKLDALKAGATIDGVEYEPIHATLDRVQGRNVWMTLDLREGKNREVKVVLEHLGLMVNRLIRVSFGPFQLGELQEGQVEEIRTRTLKDQLGERLAAEAGVDFDGPRTNQASMREERAEEARPPRPDRPPREAGGKRFERDERPRRDDRGPPRRFVGERSEEFRGRVLTDQTDPYAPPPGERSRKPAERNVYRDDDRPTKPPHKRTAKEEFAERRRAVFAGEAPEFRVERGETADRAGRKVRVERIVGPPAEEEARPERRPFQRREDGDRPPRRFDRDDARPRTNSERPFRKRWSEGGGDARPPRRDDRPPRADGDRPFRKPRFEGGGDARPPRRFDRDDRPPRADGDRPFRKPRFEGGGDARPPRRFDRDDRPPRADGDRPFRKPRSEGGADARPPRRFDRDDRPPRADGDRPPRRDGDRPGGGFKRGAGGPPRGRSGGFGGKPGGGYRGKPGGGGGRGRDS